MPYSRALRRSSYHRHARRASEFVGLAIIVLLLGLSAGLITYSVGYGSPSRSNSGLTPQEPQEESSEVSAASFDDGRSTMPMAASAPSASAVRRLFV
jgi:hypothetical protein